MKEKRRGSQDMRARSPRSCPTSPDYAIIEAAGRGLIVSEKMKNILIDTAKDNDIKYQLDVIEGGMTDGAIIHMNREGVPTGVFHIDDLGAAIELAAKALERLVK